MTRQTSEPLPHHSLGASNRFVEYYVIGVAKGDLILDAPYQRGDVWTESQRIDLVRSWLMGIPVPAVYLNNRDNPDWRDQNPDYDDAIEPLKAVIDGAQRIRTGIDWLEGRIAVPASWFPADHIESTEETDDGPYVRFTGLTVVGQRKASAKAVLASRDAKLGSVKEEAEVYLLVNGAGTPQTEADMSRAARVAGQER